MCENDTFESVILESVKIESVRVDRHPRCISIKYYILSTSKLIIVKDVAFAWP